MPSFKIETCEHGFPKSVSCPKCNPPERDPNAQYCQHGRAIEDFCRDCQAIKYKEEEAKRIENKKNTLRETINNPKEILKRYCVPAKYLNSSFETFAGNDKLVTECRTYKGGGLVLFGNTGCGKTHLAVSIMRNLYITNITDIVNKEWDSENCYEAKRQIFKPIPDLLLEIRSSFQAGTKETEEAIIDKYSTIPFLVLDDLGSEKTTEFAITTLYIILDHRDRELMPTVITTNLNNKEIEDKLGARIASRMAGMKNIKINMPDYRKMRKS